MPVYMNVPSYGVPDSGVSSDNIAYSNSSMQNVSTTKQALDYLMTNKVTVVSGKGLSANDFTNELKTKLDNLKEQISFSVVDSFPVEGEEGVLYIDTESELFYIWDDNASKYDVLVMNMTMTTPEWVTWLANNPDKKVIPKGLVCVELKPITGTSPTQYKTFIKVGDGTTEFNNLKYITYPDMIGATSNAPGTEGLVPAPAAGYEARYLAGDGTWKELTNGALYRVKGGTPNAGGGTDVIIVEKSVDGGSTWKMISVTGEDAQVGATETFDLGIFATVIGTDDEIGKIKRALLPSMKPATASTIGGVIVGSDFSVSNDGTISIANSPTGGEQTTSSIRKFTYDADGLITGSTAVSDESIVSTITYNTSTSTPTLQYVTLAGGNATVITTPETSVDTTSSGKSSKNLITAGAVNTAVEAMKYTTSAAGSGKTLTALSQTDGILSATFGDISVTSSQISNKDTTLVQSISLNGGTQTAPTSGNVNLNVATGLQYKNSSGTTTDATMTNGKIDLTDLTLIFVP